MTYEIGARVLDYEILAILGAGGMGKVYKVRNLISDRIEAMKVLLPNLEDNPDLADRFTREIKLQASLSHRNIASLHTALHHENQLLMVMEYVEGMTLDALIKSGPLRIEECVDYFSQVLDALAYAHAKGVIHRDLKPANMMLMPDGTIKLLDFGIAKLAADRSLTRTGFIVGSLPYMSPEQIQGMEVDARSDIYSLGICLYEAVTGKQPFRADSEYSLMKMHLHDAPAPPAQVMPDVPPSLNEIILTAVAKEPSQRFQSAESMRTALGSMHGGPAQTVPGAAFTAPPPVPAPKQFSNRGLYMTIGSLLTLVVLILAATQAPKFFATRAAEEKPTAPVSDPAPAPAPAESKPAEPPADPTPQPPAQSAPAAETAPSAVPELAVKKTGGKPQTESKPAPVAPRQQPVQQSAPTPAAPPPPPQNPPSQPAQESPKNTAQLQEMREQLILLGTRAGAAKSSIDRLRQEQARQGLGLRGDITAAVQRMEYYLDEAEAALKRGDAAAARKYLDSGEREVSKVETFLGR